MSEAPGLLPTCRRKERSHVRMRLPPNQWFLVGRIAVGLKVGRVTKTTSRKTRFLSVQVADTERVGKQDTLGAMCKNAAHKYVRVAPREKQKLITMLHKHDAHSSRRITTNEVTDEKQHRSNTSSQTIRKDRRPAETPCLDDHPFSPEVFECSGELAANCVFVLFQKACNWPEWEDRFILHGQHARSVTKKTIACDKRLARLIHHINQTHHYRQYCSV